MRRAIIGLILLTTIIIEFRGAEIFAQRPSDSLIRKVVIFRKPEYGSKDSIVNSYMKEGGFPQATGFYLKPDSGEILYIVTAKHVVERKDSIDFIRLQWKAFHNKASSDFSSLFRAGSVGLYHQDTLVDLVLVSGGFKTLHDIFSTFNPSDIMTKEEFLSVKPEQEMFFIGRYPNSKNSNKYWFPTGRLIKTYSNYKISHDTIYNQQIAYDFKILITGKPGISGSPVLMKVGDKYKVFGLINGHLLDSLQTQPTKNFIGTGAFRILDILKNHSLY